LEFSFGINTAAPIVYLLAALIKGDLCGDLGAFKSGF
jgi:hypothetical protein